MLSQLADPVARSAGLGVFFAIGLLGGAHCLGMCGPLVTTYATRMHDGESRGGRSGDRIRWRDARQHALFNLGRTASYAVTGAVMGALGMVLFDTADIVAVADLVRGVAGVGVGGLILAIGGRYLLGGTGGGPETLPLATGVFERATGFVMSRIDRLVDGPGIVLLGGVHALLPCPLLFPAYLYAFARGSPPEGALALGVLGLGTFPTLFALGTLSVELSARRRVVVHRALGAVFLLLGFVALTHGLRLLGVPAPRLPLPVYQPLS